LQSIFHEFDKKNRDQLDDNRPHAKRSSFSIQHTMASLQACENTLI